MPKPSAKVICPSCNQEFSARGLTTHQRACEKAAQDHLLNEQVAKELRQARKKEERAKRTRDNAGGSARPAPRAFHYDAGDDSRFDFDDDPGAIDPVESANTIAGAAPTVAEEFKRDDIKVEYHPHSRRDERVYHFEEFRQVKPSRPTPLCDTQPWLPFRSRLDFEVAELALHTALSKDESDHLIKLIHRAMSGQEDFTLTSDKEIREIWESSSHHYIQFECHEITVPYQRTEHKFDVHVRPLMDWALDLLKDPHVGPHAVFDAERLFKYDGENFVRFYDEPWTAEAFWKAQVCSYFVLDKHN